MDVHFIDFDLEWLDSIDWSTADTNAMDDQPGQALKFE